MGHPRLHVWTGLAIERHPGMDGVTFEVSLSVPQQEEKSLLRLHQRSTDWREHSIDLDAYRGKDVTIEWRTLPGPVQSNTTADWGAWGEPQMLAGDEDNPTVSYDFTADIRNAETGIRDPGWTFTYDRETIGRYIGLPLLKGPVVTTPFFALKMQSMLSGTELPVALGGGRGGISADEAAGVIASRDDGRLTVLLWTFDLGHDGDRQFAIDLSGLQPGKAYVLRQSLLDRTHSNPYYDYAVRGKNTDDGAYNLETGRLDVVRDETVTVPASGILTVTARLEPMAVSTFELLPK